MKNSDNLKKMVNRFPEIPKVAGVYKITCLKTNRCYVGSSANLNKRAHQYTNVKGGYYKHIKGLDCTAITFEVLENCKYLSMDQRMQLELDYIISLNTVYPIGFNKRCPVTLRSLLPVKTPYKPKERPVKPVVKKKTKQVTNYGKPAKVYINVLMFR